MRLVLAASPVHVYSACFSCDTQEQPDHEACRITGIYAFALLGICGLCDPLSCESMVSVDSVCVSGLILGALPIIELIAFASRLRKCDFCGYPKYL